jgi:probable F420-dependent oxidoreductase
MAHGCGRRAGIGLGGSAQRTWTDVSAVRRYDPLMRYGIALPNFTGVASPEAIEAAAAVAERLGWDAVWTTDHVLVDRSDDAADYRVNYDAIGTLAWVGGRHRSLRLGTSVIVVPQRNAVILAKELATLDALSGGRVVAGVGVGWNRREFGNLAAADRFEARGAYLSETIVLWRHLWSGSSEPFEGRFHQLDDFIFGPLPAQGAKLPIWIGGRSEPALRRAGRLADGYHSSATSPEAYAKRVPVIRAAADEAGRPMPALSARTRVEFGTAGGASYYAMRGSSEEIAAEVRKYAELGVSDLAVAFNDLPPDGLVAAAERFAAEVVPLV